MKFFQVQEALLGPNSTNFTWHMSSDGIAHDGFRGDEILSSQTNHPKCVFLTRMATRGEIYNHQWFSMKTTMVFSRIIVKKMVSSETNGLQPGFLPNMTQEADRLKRELEEMRLQVGNDGK